MFLEGFLSAVYLTIGVGMSFYFIYYEDEIKGIWPVWCLWLVFPFTLPLVGLWHVLAVGGTSVKQWVYHNSWWGRYFIELLRYEKNLGDLNKLPANTLYLIKNYMEKFPPDNWYTTKLYERTLERIKEET